ncbi:MAG TPA: bifunctional glutamate N-acetyltransferase/amino-acid acetyltransferase ArgJ [Dehalococcoidia bacterium]|nr:bifunctional glutamate N-acetyltransferase/amino-acid acetyltransferase ArgJ [Dehalococcoidia bacterium]
MSEGIDSIPDGGVTSPRGFLAGAARVGVRPDSEKLDLGVLYAEAECAAAGVYTRNQVKAAPVLITRKHLASGHARAVIANSGCANAATGEKGLSDAVEMARLAGAKLGIDPHEVVVASTGVIGTFLPMDRIRGGVDRVVLSDGGGADFARAIMTTDTRPKQVAVRVGGYVVGGVAKGAGMIHPNMATMLCFLTTDAPVAPALLAASLTEAVDASFNMIDIDSDTSTNDMVVVMANGLAGGDGIGAGGPGAAAFATALTAVCTHLAKAMAADAEGGTKLIEARVEGARSAADARAAAREVVRSLAVKTAVYGHDPNWGRILAAVGNSGAEMSEGRTALYLASPDGAEVCLFRDGSPQPYDPAQARACLLPREVRIRVDLGFGDAAATAWGSDLTEEYVRLNSQYTT